MKKALRKLTLSRETLHLLDNSHLKAAAGGASLQDTCSVDVCPPTFSCRTCVTACNRTTCY